MFNKYVTVCSNATDLYQKIYIKGEILRRPMEPDYLAPVVGVPSVPSDH